MLYIAFLRFLHNRILLGNSRITERLWVWGKSPLIANRASSKRGFAFFLSRPLRYVIRSFNYFLFKEVCKHSEEISRGRLEPHLGGHFGKTTLDEGSLLFLKEQFSIKTMIDVGCGPGGQVELARQHGIDAIGVDGDYTLKLDKLYFFSHDFTKGKFTCERSFDLAWCVEFLEHVEEKYQAFFMDTLQKARIVACTSAPPGCIGHHHVNCREQTYWLEVFAKYGFAFDAENTARIKEHSSMRGEFMQDTGMIFVKKN